MVHLKEVADGDRKYLLLLDREDSDPKSGKRLAIRPSLLRPVNDTESLSPRNFLKHMSTEIELNGATGVKSYMLHNTLPERDPMNEKPSILGRSIISGSAMWKSNTVKFAGDSSFVPRFWEWAEDVLSRFGEALKACSAYDAVYASLYSYDRDTDILRAFCECWCPTTNTIHTMAGELSISLWDLFRLGGLPIFGRFYDEAVPDIHSLRAKTEKGERYISKSYEFLLAAYHHLDKLPETKKGVSARQWADFWCKKEIKHTAPIKRKRKSDGPPKYTHNPSGNLRVQSPSWTTSEKEVFDSIGIQKDGWRKTTYIAAFLSCWLCAFTLPQNEDKLIRPGTFEVAVLMARGETFSLAVPVLASIYRGLNIISRSQNPSYSGTYFPAHYLYGWLAHYFNTHHVLEPSPRGPLIVLFSGAQRSKFYSDVDARRLIHEGSKADIGCTIMDKNKNTMLFDDGKLGQREFSYLIALRSGFLPLRHGESFHMEPYLPYRFSRQFGFCQDIPSSIARGVNDRDVSYKTALRQWKILLYKGSESRVCAPCLSLDWHNLKTQNFRDWWPTVSIDDVRLNIGKLCSSAESDSTKSKKNGPHSETHSAHPSDKDASRHEGTAESVGATCSKRDRSIAFAGEKEHESKGASDAESESDVDFKHQRRKRKEPKDAALGDDTPNFATALDHIPIPPNIPADLSQVGDLDLELETLPPTTPAEENHDVSTPLGRSTPGKGKEIRIDMDLIQQEHSPSPSPTQSHHSVEGPSTFEVNAKLLGNRVDAKVASTGNTPVPAASMSAIRVTPASRGIFTKAMTTLGCEYLKELKNTPFEKVSERHKEASEVYKLIKMCNGDPEPLQRKVDKYVWDVKAHLLLKNSMAFSQRFDKVEEEKHVATEKLQQAESSYNMKLREREELEVELAALVKRESELVKELEDVRQRKGRMEKDLGEKGTSLTSLEALVDAARKRVEELEATPVCSPEEIALFEEQQRKLIEFQSSLDSPEWANID